MVDGNLVSLKSRDSVCRGHRHIAILSQTSLETINEVRKEVHDVEKLTTTELTNGINESTLVYWQKVQY